MRKLAHAISTRKSINFIIYQVMEFIFELFAEILGRADDGAYSRGTQKEEVAQDAQKAEEAEPLPEPQPLNIFNVVNFH